MTACVRPDCVGSYGPEGYCDECGRRAPVGNAGYVGLPPGGGAPVSDGSSASAGSTPSAAMTRGTASSSGRTGTRGTGRGRLGGGLLDVPRMPRRDPTTAVLADPQVPESRRYCATCGRPVGRSRDGRPGLVEGFCTNDRTPYSFRPALDPGTAVAGRYEVLGTLAYGGLGWIYLARDRNVGDEVSDRWVVLKGLIDSGDADATAAAITERRFLVEVDHPAIVKIYDFVSHPDPRSGDRVGYIVMEYVGGRSLRDIYLDQPVVGGARQPLPLPHVIAYGLEVLPALGYLHERGLLYCDFKPDNVLHADDRITLVDLGAVRRIDDDVSAVWGTTGYQAPEVATVGPSASSDLYTVARSMAVLSFDFRGFSTAYLDKLPGPETVPLLEREESYYRLLRRATHPDPARRFGSAAEMTEQLLGVLRQVLASDGVPRPNVSAQFTGERRAFGTRAGQVDADATAHQTRPGAASVVAGLPIPQVDPADPAAALLATVQTADPDVLAEALSTLGSTGVEARLAVVRARLVSGDVATARTELAAIERVGDDWRLDWYDGLVALAEERFGDARQAFDRVYDALPGELAPQLALAATAELVGDGETARRLYERVWRTDHAYVSAAFGLARILAGADDRAAAVAVLDTVPESSSHSVPAQIAAVRARLGAEPTRLAESELLDVSTRVERLGLGVERRAWLTVETLRAALDWVRAGNGGAGRVLSHTLSERELRFGLERAFRVLSKVAADQETRIGLVDQANSYVHGRGSEMTECPECAARVDAGDRFCEACGSGLSTGAGRLSSRSTDRTCRSCGATVGSDGYCDSCGRRCPVGRDRCELDLGEVAAATDLGHRRARNEDAVAVGSVRTGRVAVVCDGVSSSPDADAAANVAADTAIDTLLRALGEDTPPDVATVAAFRAAARAVATLGRSTATGDAPSCTFVSAVVGADLRVTVGWAGDSRAYWVDEALPGAPECLTVDDSLAGQLDAAGVDSTRLSLPPDAFGLTRWLGADAPAGDPHLVTFAPSRTGAVVLCSDGLSRYLPSPAVLAQLAAVPTRTTASSATTAMTAARRLTTFALNAGGIDNIAVAVIPVTVGTTSDDHPQIDPRGAPTDE